MKTLLFAATLFCSFCVIAQNSIDEGNLTNRQLMKLLDSKMRDDTLSPRLQKEYNRLKEELGSRGIKTIKPGTLADPTEGTQWVFSDEPNFKLNKCLSERDYLTAFIVKNSEYTKQDIEHTFTKIEGILPKDRVDAKIVKLPGGGQGSNRNKGKHPIVGK